MKFEAGRVGLWKVEKALAGCCKDPVRLTFSLCNETQSDALSLAVKFSPARATRLTDGSPARSDPAHPGLHPHSTFIVSSTLCEAALISSILIPATCCFILHKYSCFLAPDFLACLATVLDTIAAAVFLWAHFKFHTFIDSFRNHLFLGITRAVDQGTFLLTAQVTSSKVFKLKPLCKQRKHQQYSKSV